MNKVLIAILIFGAAGLAYYFIGGNKNDLPFELDVVEETDVELVEQALKETNKRTVYASCNAITSSSNCIDYVGSMWQDNDMARLNCSEVGTFSENACPYSIFGGCQMSGDSVMEMITWAYQEGPGGYNDDSVVYARMACNALPSARWLMPEELLE